MAGMNSGKPFSQDYRQPLAPEPRETTELPGDLHSLSWLTTVDVTRLQQTALYWPDLHTDLEISTKEPQTDQKSLMKRTDEYNPIVPLSERNADSTWNDAVCRSCHTENTFYEQHLVVNPHRKHFSLQQNKTFPKPIYSYSCLIAMALKNSPTCSLTVSEIYRFMSDTFPYFKTAPEGWKNSVRHNLSLNKCFEKVQNKLSSKGYLWVLNPAIHERESRRSRNGNVKISLRAQTDQTGGSLPDWDQSSHTVLNCSQSNPTWHTPYKDLHGLHILRSDVPGQADNSDPYLIEFAGNLWEEMKEESLSPETEDNSKKCLFDSKFVVSEAEPLLLDQLPMAGPYTTYTKIGVPFQNLF